MVDIHKHTNKELRQILYKQAKRTNAPVEVVEMTLDEWQKEKALVRAEKAKRSQHKRLWRELLQPARAELKNVRAMLHYEAGPFERQRALALYIQGIERFLNRLENDTRTENHTPSQLAEADFLPNKGVHWTDWVKSGTKNKVREAFEAIPRGGVKIKTPFERKIPKALCLKLKKRLFIRTQKELEAAKVSLRNAELERDAAKIAKRRETIANIKVALTRIEEMGDTEAVPTTWHGLFGIVQE
jgi:hypothetical protein